MAVEGLEERRALAIKRAMALADAIKRRNAQAESPVSPKVLATTDDGGQVLQMPDGTRAFKSPAYATTDPARIDEIMQGATPADVATSGFDRDVIGQHPVASRGVKVLEGTPFIGSYVDEAAGAMFGDKAKQGVRAVSGAMEREKPRESTALQLTGTVAGAVPMAMAAAPSVAASAPSTLGSRVAGGALLGAAVGGAEGAVYGAGEGEGRERVNNAVEQGTFGVIAGGAAGTLLPVAGDGIKAVLGKLRRSPVKEIETQLGVSAAAARVIKNALDTGDMDEAAAALDRAGGNAMLADAGQPARELLDAAANAGGRAGAIARDAVEERVSVASEDMQRALNKHLGPVADGLDAMGRDVRQATAQTRKTAYADAYAAPIDYASPRGRLIERLLSRVPEGAIRDANELMRLEGVQSGQIMAQIADDGTVTYSRLPDVRQIHYILQGLGDTAAKADGKGKLGGTTRVGRAYNDLRRNLSDATKRAVPEFATAQNIAADAISEINAGDFGYNLLRAKTTRDNVFQGLNGMSAAERRAAKQGVRTFIDDTLANVARTVTDPNTDAREGIKLIRDLSSRANQQKMRALLGGRASKELADELDIATTAFELRAAIAQNSKTAIRQSIQGSVADQSASGTLESLTAGEAVNAGKRFVQIFTGNTAEAQQLRAMGIYEEIAEALVNTRGDNAKRALNYVNAAMNGERLTSGQAQYIGRVVSTSALLTGSHKGREVLTPQLSN